MRDYDEMDTKKFWANRPAYKGVSREESLKPGKPVGESFTPEQIEKRMKAIIAGMSPEEVEKSLSC